MSKNKKITWTPAKVKQLKKETTCRVVALTLACLMDEFGMGEEELIAYTERFYRYSEAVDTHLISVKKVLSIVEQETGMQINW